MTPNFGAENFTNVNELQALVQMIGPYGIKYLGDQLMLKCEQYVHDMLKIVTENKALLIELRAKENMYPTSQVNKQLKDHDQFIHCCVIVGALLNFRQLTLEATKIIVGKRAPFLQNCIIDFKENFHLTEETDTSIPDEMATAAGFKVDADPALCSAIQKHCQSSSCEHLWTLLNVMIAVALPLQSFKESSVFKTTIEGHENNIHCVSTTVTWLSHAAYTVLVRNNAINTTLDSILKERMREFIELFSSRLLKLQLETDREVLKDIKQKDSLYIILERLVQESKWVTYDMLEQNFPYTILRNSYRIVYERKKTKRAINNDNEM